MKYNIAQKEIHLETLLKEVNSFSETLRNNIVAIDSSYVYTVQEFSAQELTDFNTIYTNHDSTIYSPYRILNLVNSEFRGLPLENVDFARHLGPDMALNKVTNMLPSGRPDKCEYLLGQELIAEIEFIFETNSSNLITKRQEFLYYYREDETKSQPILIKEKSYDPTSLVDGAKIMNEREESRKNIVNSMKAFIAGALMQGLQMDLSVVTTVIKPFWDDCEKERRDFIELGNEDWKNYMVNLDPNDFKILTTENNWLDIVIAAPTTTIQQFVISKLIY